MAGSAGFPENLPSGGELVKAAGNAAALRQEGVPAVSQKKETSEDACVSAVLSFLSVIDNPRQDVALIAVLRSPLFGFTTDELAAIRASDKDGDFYSALTVRAQRDAKCAEFMALLLRCREAAPEIGLERLLRLVYDETGVTASSDSGGLYALLEAARSFEARGGVSPWGTVTVLGEVMRPGPVNMPSTMDMTVTKVLQEAGGCKPFADKSSIRVTRCERDGTQSRTTVDIKEIGKDGRVDKDMQLRAGDVVWVPETWY